MVYHPTNFDALVQSGFWVISKTRFANLCKSDWDVIIIPVSTVPSNLEKLGEEEGKLLNLEYLENEMSFLDEIKSIFHNFKDFYLIKYK